MRELAHRAVRRQYVHDLLVVQVPAGHERGTRAQLEQGPRGAGHLAPVPDLLTDQDCGFVEVGRHERGEGYEALRDQSPGLRGQQPLPRRRDHHGIEHVVRKAVPRERGGHGLDDLR